MLVMPIVTSPESWRHHRSEEHTSELQSQSNLVCRLLLEKKKKRTDIVDSLYVVALAGRECAFGFLATRRLCTPSRYSCPVVTAYVDSEVVRVIVVHCLLC